MSKKKGKHVSYDQVVCCSLRRVKNTPWIAKILGTWLYNYGLLYTTNAFMIHSAGPPRISNHHPLNRNDVPLDNHMFFSDGKTLRAVFCLSLCSWANWEPVYIFKICMFKHMNGMKWLPCVPYCPKSFHNLFKTKKEIIPTYFINAVL